MSFTLIVINDQLNRFEATFEQLTVSHLQKVFVYDVCNNLRKMESTTNNMARRHLMWLVLIYSALFQILNPIVY